MDNSNPDQRNNGRSAAGLKHQLLGDEQKENNKKNKKNPTKLYSIFQRRYPSKASIGSASIKKQVSLHATSNTKSDNESLLCGYESDDDEYKDTQPWDWEYEKVEAPLCHSISYPRSIPRAAH